MRIAKEMIIIAILYSSTSVAGITNEGKIDQQPQEPCNAITISTGDNNGENFSGAKASFSYKCVDAKEILTVLADALGKRLDYKVTTNPKIAYYRNNIRVDRALFEITRALNITYIMDANIVYIKQK